ncbi:hypothetical protein [Caulobacter segnis]|uniref:hypothetical protein n=1 Tax=Caulobacter segnis TaxID=88688 RepID=UPI0026F0B8C3|nr:hypothetical protein [Caulobacter segnis]
MAIDDYTGEPVIFGSWLYGGTVRQRIAIVACNFDRAHADYLEEMEHVREQHGGELPPPSPPRPLGSDGVLYHVGSSPDFETVAEAKAWVDAQPWGPVIWDA